MTAKLILASGSAVRRHLLAQAGLDVKAIPSDIDERAVEGTMEGSGATPDQVALVLAEAKAVNVSEANRDALVIGSDQVLSLGDAILHKAGDMDEARRRLLALSGRTHRLNCAVVLARDGQAVWRHVGTADLTMRRLDPAFIGRHLASAGPAILSSVGAYQIEGEGIQLFERIEGDMFTIMGLPLLPLLAKLRDLGAIDG